MIILVHSKIEFHLKFIISMDDMYCETMEDFVKRLGD